MYLTVSIGIGFEETYHLMQRITPHFFVFGPTPHKPPPPLAKKTKKPKKQVHFTILLPFSIQEEDTFHEPNPVVNNIL